MLTHEELMAQRRESVADVEATLQNIMKPEERMFYYHPSEDHIVLSHALFWVMSKPLVRHLSGIKSFIMLRTYQEEMLAADLTESPEFSELLHFCNVMCEMLPYELSAARKPGLDRRLKKLKATATVAIGYGGDMAADMAYDFLDDIDFKNNQVYCRKIEQMLPKLSQMVTQEMAYMG